MSYRDNVRAAVAALNTIAAGEDANWTLARLTLQTCGPSGRGGANDKPVTLEQWSADIKASGAKRAFSSTTAGYYRRIWERFGKQYHQGGIEWGDAYDAIRGGTVPDRMASADFNRALEHGTPEVKREAFTRLSQDREVVGDHATSQQVFEQIVENNPVAVEQAVTDRYINARLQTAQYKARDKTLEPLREAQTESKATFETNDSTLEHTHFLYGVQSRVEQWAHELHEVEAFLQRVDDVNVMTRRSTRRSLELLIDAATRCRDALPHSYDEPDTEPEDAVRAAQAALKGRKR